MELLLSCYKKIDEKPSLYTNNQKCKKEQVQTNERTLILKGTETNYEMKTKHVLISKEQKT